MQLGLVGILTIIFVVCKLVNVIDWSWWWVLAPVWIGAIIFFAFLAGTMALAGWLSR